jgi:hypothetical protein
MLSLSSGPKLVEILHRKAVKKIEATAVGIHHADHGTNFADKRRSLCRYGSLVD